MTNKRGRKRKGSRGANSSDVGSHFVTNGQVRSKTHEAIHPCGIPQITFDKFRTGTEAENIEKNGAYE